MLTSSTTPPGCHVRPRGQFENPLSLATAGGHLDAPGRDAVLAGAQEAAAAAVLAQVEASLVALDGAALSSAVIFPPTKR